MTPCKFHCYYRFLSLSVNLPLKAQQEVLEPFVFVRKYSLGTTRTNNVLYILNISVIYNIMGQDVG